MNWDDILKGIIHNAGVVGVKELENAVSDLSKESKEPWKAALLKIVVEAIEKYGLKGVEMAERLVDDIVKGRKPRMEFVSLKARSDYLVVLENMEASERDRALDFINTIGVVIGKIVGAIISGVIS